MAIPQSEEYKRLQFINTLFSWVTQDNLYLAEQIKDAISYSLQELEERSAKAGIPDDLAFNAAAVELLENFFREQQGHGFFHWDALKSVSVTPLFARQELIAGLKGITKYRKATLLITNLERAIFRGGKPGAAKRRREYQTMLEYIRDLVKARTSPNADLRLLFL